MRLRIAKIHEAAMSRPPNYVQAVLSRGVVDGEWLEISDEALADLRQQFRQTPPPVAEMAVNLARAAADEAKAIFAGALAVPQESIASRMETCRACEHFIRDQNRCALCGCFAELKARMRSQHCPVGKW
jgi:hypothetical protein